MAQPPHLDNEQWTQLPMFMTANEIMSTHQPAEWDRSPKFGRGGQATGRETHEEVMARKLTESKTEDGGHLYASIGREGVKQPVHLAAQFGMKGKPQLVEGHHRVVSSLEQAPNRYIPVMHHETPNDVGNYIMDTWTGEEDD